jgi:acetylglutamate kinase
MTGKIKDFFREALDQRLASLSEEDRFLEKLRYTDKELLESIRGKSSY